MNSMRNVNFLIAALAIASLATFGCSKDDKGGEAGGKAASSKGGASASSGGAGGMLAVFPKDTGMVMGINISEISSSSVYKQFIEPQIKAKADEELAELKAECGFDPFSAIKQVIVGGPVGADMSPDEDKMLIVVKGLTRKQVSDCAEKMAQKDSGGVEIVQDGNFTRVTKDGDTTWIGWMDDSTMLAGPNQDKAALEQRLTGKDGADTNKDFMEIVGNTDQKAGIWLAMKKPAGAPSPAGVDFSAVYASIKLSGGLNLDAGMRQGSADEAAQSVSQAKLMLEQMKQQAGPFGTYLEKIELSSKGSDVLAKINLSDKELQEIIQAAGPMLGAMLGGGF